MTTKYTPGPWKLMRHGLIVTQDESEIVGTFNGVSAGIGEWAAPARAGVRPKNDANRQLIVAAPELLVALQRLVNLASHPMMECASVPNYPERIKEAQAAIAKATKE